MNYNHNIGCTYMSIIYRHWKGQRFKIVFCRSLLYQTCFVIQGENIRQNISQKLSKL